MFNQCSLLFLTILVFKSHKISSFIPVKTIHSIKWCFHFQIMPHREYSTNRNHKTPQLGMRGSRPQLPAPQREINEQIGGVFTEQRLSQSTCGRGNGLQWAHNLDKPNNTRLCKAKSYVAGAVRTWRIKKQWTGGVTWECFRKRNELKLLRRAGLDRQKDRHFSPNCHEPRLSIENEHSWI